MGRRCSIWTNCKKWRRKRINRTLR